MLQSVSGKGSEGLRTKGCLCWLQELLELLSIEVAGSRIGVDSWRTITSTVVLAARVEIPTKSPQSI